MCNYLVVKDYNLTILFSSLTSDFIFTLWGHIYIEFVNCEFKPEKLETFNVKKFSGEAPSFIPWATKQ